MIFIGGLFAGWNSDQIESVHEDEDSPVMLPNGKIISADAFDKIMDEYVQYNAAYGGDRSKRDKERAKAKGKKVIPTAIYLDKSLLP